MTDPLIGQHLGDYLIEGVLGTGGMARVYRGHDANLDRYAAIKVIEPQLIASAEEDEYRERFLREARAIARLSHPRIVSVYQFNQMSNLYYIAMEYVEGRNLREVLKDHLRSDELMPTRALLKVLHDIADALDYAHRQDIIHRDVKPSNIIVTGEGNAVLTDFGLALNAVEGTIGNTFGSVHYIAPEQAISSAQAVPQSDQYSLGIVAYEMLTGRVPFDDASAMSVALKHISDPPPPPSELNPNVPPEVEQVLLKVLDKEVHNRYDSAREFVNALEMAFDMLEDSNIAPPPDIPEERLAPSKPAQPVPAAQAALDDNSPTLSDTGSRPQTADDNDQTATMLDKSTSSVPPNGNDNNPAWSRWMAAAFVLILLILGGSFVLFGEFNIDTEAATETAVARAETIAQATGDVQTDVAMAEATEDALTETAQAEADASAQAATQSAEATETALADAEAASETPQPTATDTPEPSDTPTNTPPPTATVTATSSNTPRPTRTPRPSRTPTPALFIADSEEAGDMAQILLRYDGRMIIVGNRSDTDTFDISDLRFVLFEPDDEGDMRRTELFDIDNYRSLANPSTRFNPERCLQILDSNEFRSPPAGNPLTDDLCGGTPFWLTTTDVFWTSSNTRDSYFEVRLGPVDVLTRCPVNVPQTRSEQRCVVDLGALP
jgi:serine/threonine protein kinase